MFRWLLVPIIVAFPTLAWAIETASTSTAAIVNPNNIEISDLPSVVGMMLQAFQSKNWMLLAGLILAIVVFVLKVTKILDKIKLGGKWGIRMSTVILSTLTSVSLGLLTDQGWWAIVSTGLGVAFAAIGSWEVVGKLVRDGLAKLRG